MPLRTRSGKAPSAWANIALLTVARLVINTGLRVVYPFLPVLARGVDRPVADLSRLLALRGASGLLSPAFGPLSDRFGRRPVLVGSLLCFAAGAFALCLWPGYWPLAVALVLISLSKIIFDPALQGMVADQVAYARRGVAMAATELSWAGALLIGAPVAGWLIARGSWSIGALPSRPGWTLPFALLGAGALLAALIVWIRLPASGGRRVGSAPVSPIAALSKLRRPGVAAAAGFVGAIMLANEMVFVMYGQWLEQSYGMQVGSLGMSVIIIGGAELVGEGAVGWIVDRAGKRLVVVGMALGAAAFMLCFAFLTSLSSELPKLGPAWMLPVLTLGGAFLCFEMAYVGSLPLISELDLGARATIMSLVVAAMSVGRMLGALLGPQIWHMGGMAAVAVGAAMCFAAGGGLVAWAMREPEDGKATSP